MQILVFAAKLILSLKLKNCTVSEQQAWVNSFLQLICFRNSRSSRTAMLSQT